ncbi:MAG: hypothetical protein VX460_13255 [Planctomycetota bacterium]|nr:hypothetical protein [Planctomycetota bacterium]
MERIDHADRGAPGAAPLGAERALRASLRALRVAFEGLRSGPESELAGRALSELHRAERAALDLVASSHERPLRPVSCSVSEVITSLRAVLDLEDRRRCHLVLDGDDAAMFTDGRLLVDALERAIHARLQRVSRVMVHAHVEGSHASFNLVDTPDETELAAQLAEDEGHASLAEGLLVRDVERLGGAVALRTTGAHRCAITSLPLTISAPCQEVAA